MTLDEMKSKSATLRERTDRADQLLAEIDQMRRWKWKRGDNDW